MKSGQTKTLPAFFFRRFAALSRSVACSFTRENDKEEWSCLHFSGCTPLLAVCGLSYLPKPQNGLASLRSVPCRTLK